MNNRDGGTLEKEAEIEVIDFSLRAPRLGLLFLCLPGLGFLGACWWLWRLERMVAKRDVAWNPAIWRLLAGASLAHATILLHLLVGYLFFMGAMGYWQ